MLVDAMAHALAHYQRRNLRVLLDALSTTTSVIGPAWQEPAAAQLGQRLVPPLFQRWQRLQLWEREGAPCMDGLATVAGALRAGFEPFAAAVFERAVAALQWAQQAKQSGGQGADTYDPDLHMSSLDLLAGLAVGLRASLDPLLASHPLVQPLLAACGDEANGVRQSGFALLGDLARGCPGHVLGALPQAAKLAMANLEAPMLIEDNMAACNNATWALGELFMQVSDMI
jgi:transportin-1